ESAQAARPRERPDGSAAREQRRGRVWKEPRPPFLDGEDEERTAPGGQARDRGRDGGAPLERVKGEGGRGPEGEVEALPGGIHPLDAGPLDAAWRRGAGLTEISDELRQPVARRPSRDELHVLPARQRRAWQVREDRDVEGGRPRREHERATDRSRR